MSPLKLPLKTCFSQSVSVIKEKAKGKENFGVFKCKSHTLFKVQIGANSLKFVKNVLKDHKRNVLVTWPIPVGSALRPQGPDLEEISMAQSLPGLKT